MQTLVLSLFVSTIIWLFNLEFGKNMGNVWLRPNDKNQIVFAWRSLIVLLVEPFRNSNMWSISNWDINFYTIFILVYLMAQILNKLSPIDNLS